MIELDEDRLAAILGAKHSYYGSRDPTDRRDSRFNPQTRQLIALQFHSDMTVLDVGCGDGLTLLDNSDRFTFGLGIDNDVDHVQLADQALSDKGATNVEIRAMDFLDHGHELLPESFDFVFSERGPIGYDSAGIQAALRVLKPDGLLFCEVIGNLHHQEVSALFGPRRRRNQTISTSEEVRVAMERNGVSIRFAADIVEKRYYPDIYEWLQFQCSIWAWRSGPLPRPDDARLALFADRHTTSSGEIETTHHVVCAGGVKLDREIE